MKTIHIITQFRGYYVVIFTFQVVIALKRPIALFTNMLANVDCC